VPIRFEGEADDDERKLARCVKLDGRLFLDISPPAAIELDKRDEHDFLRVHGHLIVACTIEDDSLSLRGLDTEAVKRAIHEKKLRHFNGGSGSIVLAEESKLLAQLLVERKDLFPDKAGVFCRLAAEEK
jgi:hypothetical protein